MSAPNGRWKEAFVTVEYHPAFYKNSRRHPPSVLHALTLQDSDINRSYVILVQRSEEDVSAEMFDDLRHTEYTLKYAPDDTALAASVDGGRAWTLFDLKSLTNPTDDPFWCRHRTSASLDPWPSMRAIAIEVLAAADPANPAFAVHRGTAAKEWPGTGVAGSKATWDREILGACRYACARREDPELRAALISAFLQPDFGYSPGEVNQCVGEIAGADPAAKTRLQDALANASPRLAATIRDALQYSEPKPTGKSR